MSTATVSQANTSGTPMDATISSRFSESSRNTLITTSAIGGTFIFALLIYIIYRRRTGATYAQILLVPPKPPSTPQLTPTPMRQTFAKHPIYHDLHYSIRSSRHESAVSWPPRVHMKTSAPTGRAKHKRIQSGWVDPDAPVTPTKDTDDLPNRSTFFFDASPSVKPRTPEKAHVSVRPLSQASRGSSTAKAPSVTQTTDQATLAMSPLYSPPLMEDSDTRWSWTNSQAPSTPRLRPDSRRASLLSKYSAPRYRSVKSWARGQGERLQIDEDEESPPLLPLPVLQPVPANKRAFKDSSPPDLTSKKSQKSKGTAKGHSKAASSLGGLGSFFKSSKNSKSTSNLVSTASGLHDNSNQSKSATNLFTALGSLEQGRWGSDIELSERHR